MLAFALGGAGLGLGIRGLSSGKDIFNPRPIVSSSPNGNQTVVSLTSEQDRKRPGVWLQTPTPSIAYKRAEEKPLAGVADSIYSNVIKPLGLHEVADMPFGNITNPVAKPLYGAGAVLATYGGYRGVSALMDWMLKRRRQNELSSETSSAEREYLDAIKGLRQVKYAAVDQLFEKQAAGPGPGAPAPAAKIDPLTWGLRAWIPGTQEATNNLGTAASVWGGLAAAAAIPAATLTYQATRGNSNVRALREAMLLRARNLQRNKPAPVVLIRPEGELEQEQAA